MAISSVINSLPPASRPLRDNELRAIVNALDTNNDKILQKHELNIAKAALRSQLDTNGNGQFEAEEVKQGLLADKFTVSLSRDAAVQVLLKFDSNQDGFLAANELDMNDKAVNLIDNYGASKYAHANASLVRDDNNRLRRTGAAAADGKLSISEMANAIADGRLLVGQRFFTPGSVN
jgi:PBP1b-binding outer membrane lipoprotein LpoB